MVYGYPVDGHSDDQISRGRTSGHADHEDCLSFSGGCGPDCPYSWANPGRPA